MSGTSRIPKILLIDSNVYFSKRLSDALKREGFQVLASTQPAFALTTLEYDTPTAVVCATNMRDMGALEIATIIRADSKNANLPIIALGDGSQRAVAYDQLVLAVGAWTNQRLIPGSEHAFTFKTK